MRQQNVKLHTGTKVKNFTSFFRSDTSSNARGWDLKRHKVIEKPNGDIFETVFIKDKNCKELKAVHKNKKLIHSDSGFDKVLEEQEYQKNIIEHLQEDLWG